MVTKRCECCGQALPEFGGIVADDDRGEIRFRGMAAVGLSTHEYSVFRFLLDKRGQVARREAILDHLYQLSPDDAPELKIIDVFLCKVRRKIAPLGIKIGTAWGRGYYLEVPAPEVDAASSYAVLPAETADKTASTSPALDGKDSPDNYLAMQVSIIKNEFAGQKGGK